LHQLGVAVYVHQTQVGYFPTAGTYDWAGPTYSSTTAAGVPVIGWKQDAGWAYQLLHYMDAENTWTGGGSATNPVQEMQGSLKTVIRVYFCPSRRSPGVMQYTNASFPSGRPGASYTNDFSNVAYTTVKGNSFSVFASDYAGCNGNGAKDTNGNLIQNGAILS